MYLANNLFVVRVQQQEEAQAELMAPEYLH